MLVLLGHLFTLGKLLMLVDAMVSVYESTWVVSFIYSSNGKMHTVRAGLIWGIPGWSLSPSNATRL